MDRFILCVVHCSWTNKNKNMSGILDNNQLHEAAKNNNVQQIQILLRKTNPDTQDEVRLKFIYLDYLVTILLFLFLFSFFDQIDHD